MANNIQYGYGGQGQMPNYGYQQSYNGPYNIQQPGQPSQSYTQQYGQSYGSPAPNNRAWADDEYEARSIRVPDGWPADTPFVIWNPRRPIQYIKAIDVRGVPYPMKILEYTEVQPKQSFALPGQSGASQEQEGKNWNESSYARERNHYNGQYMSRDIGDRTSGHYPTHMITYYPQHEYQDY